MKEYATLNALKHDFVSGEFQVGDDVSINGKSYSKKTSSTPDLTTMLNEKEKSVVVYESQKTEWLIFLWGGYKNNIIPYDVRTTTHPVFEAAEDIQDRIIPDKVEVHFLNLPVGGSLIAKVDTGAEMCSLHAEDVQINRGEGTVSFVAPQLSHNKITTKLTDQQPIKTSGGETKYRAVITTTIKIKGKVLKDIPVNLNDRSEMDDPMLVGQNALQQGKFLIDPNIIKEAGELLTKDFLAMLRHDPVVPPVTLTEESAQKLYEVLDQVGDISVGDLMKLLRTQVLKNLNEIVY